MQNEEQKTQIRAYIEHFCWNYKKNRYEKNKRNYQKHTTDIAGEKEICNISTKFVAFLQKETVNTYSLLTDSVL